VINCARGGIIDEAALAEAIRSGRVAGAALDVFEKEPPPRDHPLLGLPQVISTPHLGASTHEAQTAVSVDAARALLDYLQRDEIRGACNVAGLPLQMTPRDRAYADLVSRMGTIVSVLCEQGVGRVTLTTSGDSLSALVPALQRFALSALLAPFFSERLNVRPTERIRLSVDAADQRHEIDGTVFVDDRPRLLALDGYPMNLVPEGEMLLIFNDDRPGVIGFVGTTLGDLGVNIADMSLSRHANRALMVLKLDAPPPTEAMSALDAGASILRLHSVTLPPVSPLHAQPDSA
jgi:D-3-phosphoglycerate dehydrogenase